MPKLLALSALLALTACASQRPVTADTETVWRIQLEVAHPGNDEELELHKEYSRLEAIGFENGDAAINALSSLGNREEWGWSSSHSRLGMNRAVVIRTNDDARVCIGRIVIRDSFQRYLNSLPETERRIIELIDAAPTLNDGPAWNPVPMIRAVNALLALGEQKAAEQLGTYLEHLKKWEEGFPRGYDWNDDERRVQAIAMLLWSGDLLNISPRIGGPGGMPGAAYETIALVHTVFDVPYLTASGFTLAGFPEPASNFVARIRNEGKWREALLKPADNPFETCLTLEAKVESMAAADDDWELNRPYWRALFRRQCLRCTGVDTGSEPYVLVGDDTIPMLALGAHAIGLHWSVERKSYERGN
jgi:hypothetical protein